MRDYVRPHPGARVLDPGCGPGELVDHLGAVRVWSQFEEVLPLWEYFTNREIGFESSGRWISFIAPKD